ELQALVGSEDRGGGGDLVQGAVEGGELAVELAAGVLDGGDVDGGGGRTTVTEADGDDVVGLPLAADDDWSALAEGLAAAQRALDGGALARFQELDLAGQHLVCAGRFDSAHVGRIHPFEATRGTAQPHR